MDIEFELDIPILEDDGIEMGNSVFYDVAELHNSSMNMN